MVMEMCMEDMITREAAVAAIRMVCAKFPMPDGAIPVSAALNALRSVPSAWKSANDELPECRKRLLCYYPEREDVYIADLDYNFEGKIIWVDDAGIISDKEEVTLWAPLPVPPDVDVCNEAVPCGADKRMEAASGWILVTDKLPENGSICLVCGPKGGMRIARVRRLGQTPEWTVVGTGKPFNVTHWRPLPTPPDA